MMRALRLPSWGAAPELVEVSVPHPGSGQVVVEVAGCGLCHSDLAMAAVPAEMGEAMGWQVPFTLGHETAGRICEVGPGVTGWSVGDPVALSSPSSCGTCRWCRDGRDNACPRGRVGRGYGRDGGLAERVLVEDLRGLLPLGGLDPASAGPLTDAGATSYHAVERVLPRVHPGGTVVVLGVGGLGAFVVQILRARCSARVVAVDPDPARRTVAARHGAEVVLDGVGDDTRRQVRELVGPDGVDAVVDLVGTDQTIACATAVLGPAGALALVGAAGGTLRRPWYGTLPPDGTVCTFQGSDLADARAVIDLAQAGQVVVDVVPWALDQAPAALAALGAGGLGGRIVVRP